MAKFTERLDIKMTSQDMLLLAEKSLRAHMPITVYARNIIISHINPMMKQGEKIDATFNLEKTESRPMED